MAVAFLSAAKSRANIVLVFSTLCFLNIVVYSAPTFTPTPGPTIRPSVFTWKPDNITTQVLNQSNHALFMLSASHLVLPAEHSEWGHYALKVGNESTPCLDWHSSEEEVMEALQALPSIFNRGGVSVVSTIIDFGYSHDISMKNDNESSWLLRSLSIERESITGSLDMSVASAYLSNNRHKSSWLSEQYQQNKVSCDIVRTYGEWNEASEWEEGIVPGAEYKLAADTSKPYVAKKLASKANDYVIVPQESGFIQLSHSVAIGGLSLNGGNIITMESSCPSGWAKPADANNGNRHVNERVGIHAGNNIESTTNPKQNKKFGFNEHQTKCFAAFYGPSQKNVNKGGVKKMFENNRFGNTFPKPNGRDWHEAGFLHRQVDGAQFGVSWHEAEATCNKIAPGGHLANIESYYENEVVKNLCQGLAYEKLERGPGDEVFRSSVEKSDQNLVGKDNNKYDGNARKATENGESRDMDGILSSRAAKLLGDDGTLVHSQARDPQCWIGLRDENLDGNWLWTDEKSMTTTTWRSWSRHQPDNRTNEKTGEKCALMSSSLYHVEKQHLGTWQDERCDSPFAFICERPALSKGHTLTIGGFGLLWKGGAFSGGGVVKSLGSTLIASSTTKRDEGTGDFGYYDDASVQRVESNDWRHGQAWLQGINEIGLIDAARVELHGAAVMENNALITAGDGSVIAVIDERHDSLEGEFSTNTFDDEKSTRIRAHWPVNADWLWGYTMFDNEVDQGFKFNEILNNENARTALYMRSNVTLRTVKGNGPLWTTPQPVALPTGGTASKQHAYYNDLYNTENVEQGLGTSDEISIENYEALYQSSVKTNKISDRLHRSLDEIPASSHDSFIRGVFQTGSVSPSSTSSSSSGSINRGRVNVASPVTGSGRRPRLLNKAQVWFVGEEGDSVMEWYYEAGDGGLGSRNVNGTMYNATGVLIANSTSNRLSLAGGGVATGGSSIALLGGIKLDNFSLVLSTSPTFILSVTSEREVVREERAWSIIQNELVEKAATKVTSPDGYPDPTDAKPANEERSYGVNGTYRIAVRHPLTGEISETQCLPYHSTAQRVEYALSSLPSVISLGGAIVTRDGDPSSPRWGYGYKYKIVFDASNEVNKFGMNAGDRFYLKSTSGGGRVGSSSSSTSSNSYDSWAWDLEAGIMADGRKFNDFENDLYASYRNMTDKVSGDADVYISCQGSKQSCGCSDLLTFLDNNDDELNTYNQNIRNDYNEQEYLESLNPKHINTRNDKLKEGSSTSLKSKNGKVIKEFGYRGLTCRRHHKTSREFIDACVITPRITLSLLHGGGESFIHDGNISSLVTHNQDSSTTLTNAKIIAASYQNPIARQVGSSMISVSHGFHRFPSLLAGGSGLELIGGTSYVIARNFTASFVYLGNNETRFRDNNDNEEDYETFLSDGGVNGTGGLGKLGGGLGGKGLLVCSGAGFAGMDNAFLLYEGPSTQSRQFLRHSPFYGNVAGILSIENGGELRLATQDHQSSGFATHEFHMGSGSLLSGWATTLVERKLSISGTYAKRLRTAASIVCGLQCEGSWSGSGPVWFSEGSSFINRGVLNMSVFRLDRDISDYGYSDDDSNITETRGGYGPGNAYGGGSDGYGGGGRLGVLTRNDVDMGYDASRESWVEGEQQSNGASGSISSSSGKWYTNPLCGQHCRKAPYFVNSNSGVLTVLSNSNPRIGLFVRNLGKVEIFKGSRLTCGGGGDGEGIWEFGYGSVLRISGGQFKMHGTSTQLYSRDHTYQAPNETDFLAPNNGTLEVSGGGPHQLPDLFDGPRLTIFGGEVEVRSRFQDLRGGLSIHGGALTYSISSTRVFIGGENFTMTGGEMKFVEILPHSAVHPTHIHNQPKNADRSFVTLISPFLWSGGTLKGNAEIGARDEVRIGQEKPPLAVGTPWSSGLSAFANQYDETATQAQAQAREYGAFSANAAVDALAQSGFVMPNYPQAPMRLENLIHLISYVRSRWYQGDIITSNGASYIDAGSVWMEYPKSHTSRVLAEPRPKEHESRKHLLTMWEDNDASIHQDFGGYA